MTGQRCAGGDRAWFVYMVRCADGSLYTGIARDLERRVREHNGALLGGARYTRARRPVRLVYWEAAPERGAASRREREIKAMVKSAKEKLIRSARAAAIA